MKREMLVNVYQPEESRIAIVEDGVLEELYVERNSQESFVGNIYKGRIVNIEPSIQAAFVDFGVGSNGFLHVSDVESEYFKHLPPVDPDKRGSRDKSRSSSRGGRPPRRPVNERSVAAKPSIQDIFKRGDEVLVQVIKDGIGTKGPTLSTYISIPGRYLVLMPALQRVGISRKIENVDDRKHLREVIKQLSPPPGLGFIVRTAGVDRSEKDLRRDMNYLLRLWKVIVRRIDKHPAPVDVYQESEMITRTIRDIYAADIDTVLIDDEDQYKHAREFMKVVLPKHVDRVKYYDGAEPIFHKYNVEQEITKIQNRTVQLEGGGSIVIDQTEALVAIDVNSGTHRVDDDAEETSFQVNMRAAKEISRQIRLRDLGGVIVNDFIDMRQEKHRRAVERQLHDAVQRDRARTKVLRISPFGLIEMTRQRIRPSLKRSIYEECPCCNGSGSVKKVESVAIEVMRELMRVCSNDKVRKVALELHHRVATYLANKKRKELIELEERSNVVITFDSRYDVNPNHMELRCLGENNAEIAFSGATHSK
ncbi:MAG: ribonuclease E/G [Rubinisphaera brasiliensis]|uniref:Rne/Rng family ribonuclease n=1 Tax=Rubinisphaera brasiliensis TaxID=119 RepID=UPI00391BD9F9